MTPDERIEDLIGRFGQTISDLPKPNGKSPAHLIYPGNPDTGEGDHEEAAGHAVRNWFGIHNPVDIVDLLYMHQDYICHLADIIDRMEAALETAIGVADCGTCVRCGDYDCRAPERHTCGYTIDDSMLTDCRMEDFHIEREENNEGE